ncbi:MAG: MaoC/PaaZ C-terminal domain-containing protein [Candidatus Limnocylindrales bacterium]
MLTELDLQGSAAAPCELELEVGSEVALARVLGAMDGVHPVQPIAAEWCAPLEWSPAWSAAWQKHGGQAVHAWHSLVFHRELRLPLRCRLSAEVVAQRPTRAGAITVVRYLAIADDGPVWTTHAGVLWRGVAAPAHGDLREPDLAEPGPVVATTRVAVPADFAHRYSMASGIWNPVHTDPEAARSAGLEAPILHGSATLGLALTAAQEQAGARCLEELSVRFVAPVLLPDLLTVAISGTGAVLFADVRREDDARVVRLRARYTTS